MTLHLYLPPRQRIKADTRAFKAAKENTHRKLRDEIEEQRVAQDMVDRHNERVRRSQQFKQTGEL